MISERRRAPDLSVEAGLLAGHRAPAGIIGMDEVGRGALAGPVTVGAGLVRADTVVSVAGLADSKLLSPSRREAMVPALLAWIPLATGSAGPEEIDRWGITGALRLAGRRALARLALQADLTGCTVLLDGVHDWLSRPEPDLFAAADPSGPAAGTDSAEEGREHTEGEDPWSDLPVVTLAKADLKCASVAAASVVAKTRRDARMREADRRFPGYGWAQNKGYGSAGHRQAVLQDGPSPWHRLTWSLGAEPEAVRRALRQREETAAAEPDWDATV